MRKIAAAINISQCLMPMWRQKVNHTEVLLLPIVPSLSLVVVVVSFYWVSNNLGYWRARYSEWVWDILPCLISDVSQPAMSLPSYFSFSLTFSFHCSVGYSNVWFTQRGLQTDMGYYNESYNEYLTTREDRTEEKYFGWPKLKYGTDRFQTCNIEKVNF